MDEKWPLWEAPLPSGGEALHIGGPSTGRIIYIYFFQWIGLIGNRGGAGVSVPVLNNFKRGLSPAGGHRCQMVGKSSLIYTPGDKRIPHRLLAEHSSGVIPTICGIAGALISI